MQRELGPGGAGVVLCDAGERSVVVDTRGRQEELAPLVERFHGVVPAGVRARCYVPLDVEVVPHVDVAHQGRPVVDVRVLVHPGHAGLRNSLKQCPVINELSRRALVAELHSAQLPENGFNSSCCQFSIRTYYSNELYSIR